MKYIMMQDCTLARPSLAAIRNA